MSPESSMSPKVASGLTALITTLLATTAGGWGLFALKGSDVDPSMLKQQIASLKEETEKAKAVSEKLKGEKDQPELQRQLGEERRKAEGAKELKDRLNDALARLDTAVRRADNLERSKDDMDARIKDILKKQAEPVEKKKQEIALEKENNALRREKLARPVHPFDSRIQKELEAREKIFVFQITFVASLRQSYITATTLQKKSITAANPQWQKVLLADQQEFNDWINAEWDKFGQSQTSYEQTRRCQLEAQESIKSAYMW